MSEYMITWGHAYLMHFGAWVSFAFGATVYKNGLPEPKKIPSMVLSAVTLAAIVAIFSSHSHTHYLQKFIGQ
jgi:hypothetical protein